MRSGPIKPELAEEVVDRTGEQFALWERGPAAAPDLPWEDCSHPAPGLLGQQFAGARSLSVVVGSTPVSRALLDAVLDLVRPPCRAYVFADRALESDAKLLKKLNALGDRVLVRLGHRPPADWVVSDQGHQGTLFVGSTGEERRWAIRTDAALARSLFEAFRHLFWFHAAREALPDSAGVVAFRSPLPAPYDYPGDDLPLPSGRLVVGSRPDDPVPDADIRISPRHRDPGRARIVFIPPHSTAGGQPVSLDLPRKLAERGSKTVWADLGVPTTTVTRQRFLMDLVEEPIHLQLEWPRAAAVDLYHRLARATSAPAWEFHPARRLREIRGPVLLEGAAREGRTQDQAEVDTGDLASPLLDFDSSRPESFPSPPPLALKVVRRWKRVPQPLPAGARPAAIVRGWTAVDEWASRAVDECRLALETLDKQEGLLGRLRRWLPSRDDATLERRRLRGQVDELGEARPSQSPDIAQDTVRSLQGTASRLNDLLDSTHSRRQEAEDAQAEDDQRTKWTEQVEATKRSLTDIRDKIGVNEVEQERARSDMEAAEAALAKAVKALRDERAAQLDAGRETLQSALDAATAAKEELAATRPSKVERKAAMRDVKKAEQSLARNEREIVSLASWTPSPPHTSDQSRSVEEARKHLVELRGEAKRLEAEAKTLDRAVAEQFRFRKPARIGAPTALELPAPPPVPDEASPELGELFEHEKRRYLAIKTWDQLRRAKPVAERLGAALVVARPRGI